MIKSEEQVRRLAVKDYLTYLKLKYGSLSSELQEKLKKNDWVKQIINYINQYEVIDIQKPENYDVTDTKNPDGTGDPKWGEPGEKLAELFYDRIYLNETNYKLEKKGGQQYNHDYLLCINEEYFKIEVKIIASKSIRFTCYEWDLLVNENKFYDLLIVNHLGGKVAKIIRIQNVWDTLKRAFEEIELQYLTKKTEYIESLIGLQKDCSKNKNIIILNWARLINYYKSKNGNENIMIYSCEAKLIEWKREVIPDIPHFKM